MKVDLETYSGHPHTDAKASLTARLECGEVVYFSSCPFDLFSQDDLEFLVQQKSGGGFHKNISYDPNHGRTSGYLTFSRQQRRRLRGLLKGFSERATAWLAGLLPRYAQSWRLDRVHYRPEEEATRILRDTARDELLHVDAFPTRPSRGDRILRLFVNLNDCEPRTWVTSETFSFLLERFGRQAGLPHEVEATWPRRLRHGLLGLVQPHYRRRTIYDSFMLRFHHFLKNHQGFQDRGARKFHSFAPGSAWLVFSDGLAHGELRGQFALDHSYFIASETLELPELAPASLLEKACGLSVRHAA
ncbi:MAG: hypothetical protein FJ271_18525 [Planctomycetes bacterium]|nr:hypothetical protein [Planctomycetota bacterium]